MFLLYQVAIGFFIRQKDAINFKEILKKSETSRTPDIEIYRISRKVLFQLNCVTFDSTFD